MLLSSQQLHAPSDPVEFDAWALAHKWGDGLPLISPTPHRVEAMIEGAGRQAEDLIAVIPPRLGMATVETVAINAVMAGCDASYMPVLIAAIEALVDEDVNPAGIQATTNPGGPMVIVNGPVRDRLDIAYAGDALGPGHRANQTIGRALRLVMRNVGGGYPPADQSIQGSPWKLGLVVGENEAGSPWDPLHVEYGFDPNDSVVSVVNVESIINVPSAYTHADSLVVMLSRAMRNGLNINTSSGVLPFGLNPGHARMIAEAGYSKQSLKEKLFELAKIPLSDLPAEGNHPTNEWKLDGDRVLVTRGPDDVLIFVFGSDIPYHSLYFGGWGISGRASRKVVGAA